MDLTFRWFEELTRRELYEILKARAEIFIVEQQICYQDLDDTDFKSLHCFLVWDGEVAAYLRAFSVDKETVKIGRVLTRRHGLGLGRMLMEKSLKVIPEKFSCKKICLDAQCYAQGFYEKFGFRRISEDFWEEGILHTAMELLL